MKKKKQHQEIIIDVQPRPLIAKRPPLDEALDVLTDAHTEATYGRPSQDTLDKISRMLLQAKSLVREGKSR